MAACRYAGRTCRSTDSLGVGLNGEHAPLMHPFGEPMRAPIGEMQMRAGDEIDHRARDENLAWPGEIGHASRDISH